MLANAGKPAGPVLCEHMTMPPLEAALQLRRLGRKRRLQPQTAAAR
jgi:hypothetical protein